MSFSINNLPAGLGAIPLPSSPGALGAGGNLPGAGDAAGAQGSSFQDFLLKSLDQVNSMQQEANQAIETMAVGGEVNPAEVLTAVQKADLAFRLTMQIRNKLVQAYQDVQNIRI